MSYVQNRGVKVSFQLVKCPKLWLLWPQFCQSWGQNEKSGENSAQETKKGIKLVFPPQGSFTPYFGFALPVCPLPSFLFY